ncbi:MAG TPA: TlpA family protein disulfide reductase [Candidatus Coprocola pullicola]|nr:TlpA family protein disulfide reductase [Candidatus Coprocola pullicola]
MKKIIMIFFTTILLAGCGQKSAEISSVSNTNENTEEIVDISATKNTLSEENNLTIFGEFTSYTQSGEEITQSIFENADITMVNIWGTFCNPCIEEMPYLAEISKEYEQKGLQVVGIISDVIEPNDATAQEIINLTGADYTHIVLSEDLYNNFLYQIQSIPTTIFVDKNGNWVGDVVIGARDKQQWTAIVEEILKEVQDNA